MERWFPSTDGERRSSLTAERRGRPGTKSPDPTSPRGDLVAPGSRGSTQTVSTRGRRANAGADAGSQNRRRTGEVCLAILPYGKTQSVKSHGGLWASPPMDGRAVFPRDQPTEPFPILRLSCEKGS